jgi:integrase
MVILKIRGIKKVTARGRVYYYDRISGQRLYAPFGSADFLSELETVRAGKDGVDRVPPPRSGTFGGLIHAYRASPEFSGLAERTRKDYNRVLDYLKPLRHLPIHEFDQPYVLNIRDKANAKHKWRFADYVLAVLSVMFNWGIPRRFADINPAEKVPKIKRPRGLRHQNRAWTDHELDVVLAAAPEELAGAIALGAYSGLREGDMVAIPLNAITPDGFLEWRQSKTGEILVIPIHRDLKPYLKAARKRKKRKGTTIVIGKRGLPFTESGFRARFFKLIRGLEAANKIGKGLTFHGLRHTVGARLADAGADDFTIQTILGQKTATMAQRYRRNASKKRRAEAGIHLLEAGRKKNE